MQYYSILLKSNPPPPPFKLFQAKQVDSEGTMREEYKLNYLLIHN